MEHFRQQYTELKERILEKRRFIQVLSGPRQIGKTTMVLQLLKELPLPYLFVSADGVESSNRNWIEQQWEIARLKLKQSEATEFILVIDEIQKLENWSESVKRHWDDDTRTGCQIKLILLGSSRLMLQQGLTESLAGRFEPMYMSHWSFREMKEVFGWNAQQYAWFGGYPGAAELIRNEKRWREYVLHSLIETSISKDILMLTRVDKPALMKRLFELGCSYSGQILSFTKILGQLLDAGNTTTLSNYLQLTSSAGLLGGLEKFAHDEIRQRSSSPKFQVFNTALISAQQSDSLSNKLKDPAAWGRIVESCVGAHLLNNSIEGEFNLHYWREGNHEIDFVLSRKDEIIGLEIKSGAKQKAAGLKAFKKKYPQARFLLVGDSGLTWEEFIQIKPIELFRQ